MGSLPDQSVAPAPKATRPPVAAVKAGASNKLGSQLQLVLVLAALLGIGGAAGLYLTRHHG